MENKVTLITGRGKGKASRARDMTRGKNILWLNECTPASLSSISEDHDVVVIDGVNIRNLNTFKSLITTDHLIQRSNTGRFIKIKTPDIVGISNDLNYRDFTGLRKISHVEI